MLMKAFVEAMTLVSPSSRVVLLREPPVIGAIALAERLLADQSLSSQVGA
jgi:hypothetical protein